MTQVSSSEDRNYADGDRTRGGSIAYSYYVVGVIWVVLLLRFVDLQIVSVLLEPIRTEFRVSDTQLGILSGTTFALFYGFLGLPVAWIADRYDRRAIIAVCLGIWSGMSALCGLATGFPSLLLARTGVGIGEAGGQPPSYSLVCDYFPARKRSTVFAILNSSLGAGVFSGFLIGGWASAHYGWRETFVLVGGVGVAVALLVRLTVREPIRGIQDSATVFTVPPSMRVVMRRLWNIRAYRHLVMASSLFTLGSLGAGTWNASFFIRVHHMPLVKVATWLAFLYGAGGLVGAPLGGYLCDRMSRHFGDQRWQAWIPAACTAAIVPISFFVYLWPNPITALSVYIGSTILMYVWGGPTYATIQNLVNPSQRVMAAAINQLITNLLALGLGPLLVGAVSDYFRARFAENSLRYSVLGIVTVAFIWSSVHFVLATRTLRSDLDMAAGSA
jgi:MFS family permease